jgi:biopolymer transport protein ExbB
MVEFALFWVGAGGPIVVLLAGLSVVSVGLIVGKAVQLVPVRSGRAGRRSALKAWAAGATADALGAVAAGRAPADRVVALAMRGLLERREESVLRAEIESAGAAELDTLGSYVRLLEVIAMVAPLLGLLGTVLGMIDSFRSLEMAQGAANASVLAGGVWTALLTTAMGLIVAIPAAIAAGLFSAGIDRVGRDIEMTIAGLIVADHVRRAP